MAIALLTAFQLAQSPAAIPPWIKELIQTLKNPENFSTPIETLTQTIPYSHCHICREFKKHIGLSPTQYKQTHILKDT